MTLINLIPEEVVQAAARRSRLLRWSIVAALAGVLSAIPYALTLSRNASIATLRAEIDRIDQETSAVRTQLRQASARAHDLLSELERSKALRAKRAWSGVFALIASCLPADCWLQSVATDPETPAASSARPAPVVLPAGAVAAAKESVTIEAPQKLRLVGYSSSDSQPLVFVANLTDSKAFARVALQKALRSPAGNNPDEMPLFQFEIVCEW